MDAATGLVTGLVQGTATVRAASNADPTKYDEAVVTVTPKKLVTEIIIEGQTTVQEGRTVQLTANIRPAGAADKTVTWRSSNDAVVTVNQNGVAAGVAPGTAVITATANDGSGVSGQITLTVTAKPSVTSATITPVTMGSYSTGLWLEAGGTYWWINGSPHTAKTFTEAGTYYYAFLTGGANKSQTVAKLVIDEDYNVTVSDASFEEGRPAKFTDLSTNCAVLTQTAAGEWTVGWNASAQAAPAAYRAASPALQVTFAGNGSVVTGVADKPGEIAGLAASAAWQAAADIASASTIAASKGYSLTPKPGYTLLEDALRTMLSPGDQSDVIVISLDAGMSAGERAPVLIDCLAGLLQAVQELSPQAKILLVGSAGDYVRYMEDAAIQAGMQDKTFFLEDITTGVAGENAKAQQTEMARLLRNKMIQIAR